MKSRELLLKQTDEKLLKLGQVRDIQIPRPGWIHTIRKSLKMSLRQLGYKMGITLQSVRDLETREMNQTVSLKALQKFADAMGMTFVYGFIPDEGTLENLIQKRAEILARQIIIKTDKNMKLEAQGLTDEMIQKRIREKRDEITAEMPGYLWDQI